MSDSSTSSPVHLDPSDTLVFPLQAATQPQSALAISNTSENSHVVFKVKTTRPLRYLVRPNQGIIEPKGSATIVVILQQKDCDQLLRLDPNERNLSNDKFLVQSSIVDNAFCEAVANKSPKEVTEALTDKWNTFSKADLSSTKLRCQFTEPTSISPVKENAVTDISSPDNSATAASPSDSTPTGDSVAPSAKESFKEMSALRKKYDELVSFTIQLTAQRDSLMTDLDKARKQLKKQKVEKEKAGDLSSEYGLRQRRTTEATDSPSSATAPKEVAKENMNDSIEWLKIILFIVVGIIVGRAFS